MKPLALLLCLPALAQAQSFTCGDTLLDERDGKTYATVLIGAQCWMRSSLDYGTMIPHTTAQSDNNAPEKFCYDDDPANCALYGGLYQWPEAMGHGNLPGAQGLCPDGWHLPTDEEWKALEIHLGMSPAAADSNQAFRGTDQAAQLVLGGSAGLDVAYGGVYNSIEDYFVGDGSLTLLWTSSEQSPGYPYRRGFYDYEPRVYRGSGNTAGGGMYGYGVRCLFNAPTAVPAPTGQQPMRVYPNPATDVLLVDAGAAQPASYQLVDMLGRTTRSWPAAQALRALQVSELPRGAYVLNALDAHAAVLQVQTIVLVDK